MPNSPSEQAEGQNHLQKEGAAELQNAAAMADPVPMALEIPVIVQRSAGLPQGTDSSQLPNDAECVRQPETPNKHLLDLNETLDSFFSKGYPVVDVILVVSFFVKMRPNKLSGWTAIVYLASFFLSFCMHVVGMSNRCIKPVKWRVMMAYLSTVLRMLSAAALLLFLDYGVHSVAVLPPFLLVVALILPILSWRTFGSTDEIGLNWKRFKEELELRFDLSAKVVSMAFAGLAGRVLGGYAGVSIHKGLRRGFMAVAPECFLFYGLVLGLLLVLHCTVPSYIKNFRTRRNVAKVHKPLLAYVALLLLTLASVVAAEDMLRMNVFFVCFGIAVAVAVYYVWRNHRRVEEQRKPLPEVGASFSQYVLTGYITPLFSLVMATHSKYSINGAGTVSLSWLFKCFLFFGLCSILIYAVRIMVFAEMRDGDRDGGQITTYVTYGTMAITGVCFVLVLSLKFGELKNIIS